MFELALRSVRRQRAHPEFRRVAAGHSRRSGRRLKMQITFKNSVFMTIVTSTFFAASSASADVCGANGNPVVYVAGTVKPYVSAIARALYNDPKPITIVYKGITSCLGIDAILNSTGI